MKVAGLGSPLRRFVMPLTAVIMIGVMASCSSGTSSADSGAPISIKIGTAAAGPGPADIYVCLTQGIYKKNGLNASLVRINAGPDLVPALVSGSADVAAGPAESAAAAILQGVNLKFIAISEPNYNVVVWTKRDITSVSQLVGKTAALTVPNSELDYALDDLLKSHGLPEDAVHRVYTGSIPAALSAAESGQADIFLGSPPNGPTSPDFHELISLSNMPFAVGTYTVTAQYAATHQVALERFAKSEVECLQYIRTHKTQTLAAIRKYNLTTNYTNAEAQQVYKFFLTVWARNPTVDPSAIRKAFQEAVDQSKTHVSVPTNVSKYIDNSFIEEAMKG